MRALRGERRRKVQALRRDPAPSRWSYRMHRLWLTPLFRSFCRKGLPVVAILALLAAVLSDAGRRDAIAVAASSLRDGFQERPEFQVKLIAITGASDDLANAIRARLALQLPQSSFDIDLDTARGRAEGLDAVKSAELRVRSGGVLEVVITERVPVAVWRMPEGLTLIDDTGHRVAGLASRSDRPDLPLVAGQAADQAVAEALDILAAAQPLLPRLRGLVRIGERRWDIVLERDQRILLPEANPVRAVESLIALDAAQDIMARDILSVDLRIEHRPSVRLAPDALQALRNLSNPIPDLAETNL